MKLHSLMKIGPDKRIIALVGGGGKTTALYALSRESAEAGKRTVMMTTTHIGIPNQSDIDLYTAADAKQFRTTWSEGRIVAAGKIAEDGRMIEPDQEIYELILREAEAIYIEADGSNRLPLKYPDFYEPAVPGIVDQVLVICGLSALDKPFDEFCHRAGLARRKTGITAHLIDERIMAQVMFSGYGRYKPVMVLNHADTAEIQRRGEYIAELLYRAGAASVSILSLHKLLGIKEV
ncbi:MAG TPA: selenium cofactor biosynthesis protein YqeC [Bacillota bacterium]|nr:selenium cofactor biosynthesis protein YqeC [Bacillota bacterium]